MALSIRLTRRGRRHLPFYHIAVFDSRTRRDGLPVATLGFYDPLSKTEPVRLDLDKAKHWLSVGAKPSETAQTLLKNAGLRAELWTSGRKKQSKPKVNNTKAKLEKDKARSVKPRKKGRTAKSAKPKKAEAK